MQAWEGLLHPKPDFTKSGIDVSRSKENAEQNESEFHFGLCSHTISLLVRVIAGTDERA